MIKKHITGKLSIIDVIYYLEPFMVYTDDLTFTQYIEITKFINEKILEYKKSYAEYDRMFSTFNRQVTSSKSDKNNVSTIKFFVNNLPSFKK